MCSLPCLNYFSQIYSQAVNPHLSKSELDRSMPFKGTVWAIGIVQAVGLEPTWTITALYSPAYKTGPIRLLTALKINHDVG
jgi:hypothetical protein